MTINFNGKDITLKSSIRALMMYENIAEETFAPTSLNNIITYLYCIVVTSAKDYSITLDSFLDYIDENSQVLTDFATWMTLSNENQNKLKKD